MKKKALILSTGSLFTIIVVVLIFLPLVLRKVAVSHGTEWFGREISLAKCRINYFTGTIRLIDFKMYEADGEEVFISFDTLMIDTEPYRLLQNRFVIEQMYLEGLHTRVVLNDSAYNFDDLVVFYTSDTTTATDSDSLSSGNLRFEFSKLELRDAYFTGIDNTVKKTILLENINFYVPYIAWNQEEKSQAGLRFDFGNGGFFESDINMDPIGGDFTAAITIDSLDISGYAEYIAKYVNVGRFSGSTDLRLKAIGNINHPGESVISGLIDLNDFVLYDQEDQLLAEAAQVSASLKGASLAAMNVQLDSVTLYKPHLLVEIYDSTMNIMEYANRLFPQDSGFQELQKTQAEPIQEDTADWLFMADRIQIREGAMSVTDRRTDEPFRYRLSQIVLSTDTISNRKTWVDIYTNMLLNNRGTLVAQVGLNPQNPMDMVLDYTITDFMLSDLNIYSRYYMGFPILYGDMYYVAHTDIRDGIITSENKLIIHNVELGEKGRGIYDLPLKFALFLLKDKEGVITLDIPVRGNLNDPKVRIGPIIWDIFKNLILKAVAAPGKLLAGLVGGDEKQIESIDYSFADTVFTSEKQKQLDLLLELEQLKPELEIELVYFNDPALEKKEMALIKAREMYSETTGRSYSTDEEGFLRFVHELADNDTLSAADAAIKFVDLDLLDSLHTIYTEYRKFSLERYLHNQSDSTQILIVPAMPESPKNLGSLPRFEVKYGLKEENLQPGLHDNN